MRKIALLFLALIFLFSEQGNAQTMTSKKKDTSVAVLAVIIDDGDGGGGGGGGGTDPGCATPTTPNVSITQPVYGSTTGSVTINTPLGSNVWYNITPTDPAGNTRLTQSTTFSLPAGQSYNIYSYYSGANCRSAGAFVTIEAPPATLTLTTTAVANATAAVGSTAVNLVATVTPLPTGGTPDGGTVEFFLKDYPSAGSNTFIGLVNKGADGKYTLVYNSSTLPANTYTVVATFGGTGTFGTSSSNTSPAPSNGTLTVVPCSVITSASGGGIVCSDGFMQFVLLGTSAPEAVTRWYSDPGATNFVGEGSALIVTPPAFDGQNMVRSITYYGRIENPAPCSNSAIQALSTTVLYPSISTGARAFNNYFCSGGSSNLVLEGLQSPEGTIRWYIDAGATIFVGEGQGLRVSPTVTTTYYGRFEDAARYCGRNSALQSASVFVSTPSVATGATSTNSSICLGQSTQLTLQGTPGTNAVIQWYSDAGATTLVGEGNGLSVSPTVTTTYYGRFDDRSICQTTTALHPVTITMIPDNQNPTLTATPPLTGSADAGVCFKVVTLAPPTASDNCAIAAAGVTSSGIPAQNIFPVGTTTVTWNVRDVTGNLATQTQMVTITDNEKPTFTATPGVTGNADAGVCYKLVDLTAPIPADNCGIATVVTSSGIPAQNKFPVGITRVTWSVTDVHNNTTTQEQSVVISDNQEPALTATPAVTATADAGVCYKVVNLIAPTASDNCGIATAGVTSSGIPAQNRFPVGITTVTWSVRDASGNLYTQTQAITITDIEKPTFTATPGITGNADAGVCYKVMDLSAPTPGDNCGIATVVTSSGIPAQNKFPVGTTTVTWSVTDVHNNTTMQEQSVVISDNQEPALTATPGVTAAADAGLCYKVVSLVPPTAGDNCDIATAGVTSSGIPAQNRFPVGITIVTWSVRDVTGNLTTQTQAVTITDNEKPTFTATPGVTGNADAGVCYKVMDLSAPTPADNCGIATVVTSSGIPAQNKFPVGITRVTWSVTDVHNNTTTQEQSVVISDNQEPALTAIPAVTATADAGVCYKVVSLVPPTASDNCGIAAAGVTSSGIPAQNRFPVGITIVTWSVRDVTGNLTTQTQAVTITDNEKPTFTATPGVTGNADAGVCYKVVNLTAPTPVDNCGIATVVTSSGIPAQNKFPVGTTTVTWSVTDVHTNTTTQEQSVVISDNQNPTLTATPGVTATADAGVCYKVVNLAPPTASDNCGIAAAGVTVSGIPAQNRFTVGVTTVTWSVRDVTGNLTTQAQTVTVTDKEAPVISSVSTNPSSLWPPNRRMKAVSVLISSTDNCVGTAARCKVIAIESNETIDQSNGDTQVDYEILGDQLVNLRAERSASGEGREYKITVQCDDGHGNISIGTTIVRVAHTIKTPAAGSSVRIGTTINMTGTFWDVAGNKHTAKWLVDGASVNGTVTEPAGIKNGTVKGSYKLNTAGVYKLQMNVTDQKNVTSYATTNGYDEAIVVAYDPNGGYTYGGKKYRSPKGAMPSNPNVGGEMTYGFQTNYYKGATNPKGETWFILNNGEFEFNALNFEYLVVSGAKAQFKGLGKMVRNGIEQSGIAFILTVIDGQLSGGGTIDKIRMKIYNKNSGEVYYDNQPGASDADAPVTAVENNSKGDGVVIVNASAATAPVTREAGKMGPELTQVEDVELQIKAYPNPTKGRFTVVVNTTNRHDEIQLRIVDISGRVIETNNRVVAGQTLFIGDTYFPGIYFVEVSQGKARKQVKMIKLSE